SGRATASSGGSPPLRPQRRTRALARRGPAPAPRTDVRVLAIDHVQIAMPAGGEDAARAFYGGVLGMTEVPKPATLASRAGVWFRSGAVRVHLGVEPGFAPAKKAHPG